MIDGTLPKTVHVIRSKEVAMAEPMRSAHFLIIALACCVLAAGCTVFAGGCASADVPGTTTSTQSVDEVIRIQDENAKDLVRHAMVVIESAYVDLQAFDSEVMTEAALRQFDPALSVVARDSTAAATAPTAQAAEKRVDYYGMGDVYAVGSRSESGSTFGVIVDMTNGIVVSFYMDGDLFDWPSSNPAVSNEPVVTVARSAPFGETIEEWGIEMMVSAPERSGSSEEPGGIAGDGELLWVALATIANTSNHDIDFGLSYWQGKDQDGVSYDASALVQGQALGSGVIPPGGSVSGYVGFELPQDARLVSVTYYPPSYYADSVRSPVYVTWEE